MQYRIDYTTDCVKKKISARRLRILPLLSIIAFALLIWYDRETIVHTVLTVEELAQQLRQGVSASDAIGAFCEQLRGGIGG